MWGKNSDHEKPCGLNRVKIEEAGLKSVYTLRQLIKNGLRSLVIYHILTELFHLKVPKSADIRIFYELYAEIILYGCFRPS